MTYRIGDRVQYGWADGGPMRRYELMGRIVGALFDKPETVYLIHADSFCENTPPYERTAAELARDSAR